MATNNGRGIPTLPSTLIRPTTPAAPTAATEPDQAEGEASAEPADQGRGDQRAAAAVAAAGGGSAPKPRRRRPSAPAEKTNKRGLHLTDSVWDRLQYEAIRKRTTVSAVAGELLDRYLPRFTVSREG